MRFQKSALSKGLTRQVIYRLVVDPKTGSRKPRYRNYGAMRDDSLHDISKSPGDLAQIYGFVLAGNTRLAKTTLAERFLELNREVGDVLSPNLLVVLSGTLLSWGRVTTEQPPEVRQPHRWQACFEYFAWRSASLRSTMVDAIGGPAWSA